MLINLKVLSLCFSVPLRLIVFLTDIKKESIEFNWKKTSAWAFQRLITSLNLLEAPKLIIEISTHLRYILINKGSKIFNNFFKVFTSDLNSLAKISVCSIIFWLMNIFVVENWRSTQVVTNLVSWDYQSNSSCSLNSQQILVNNVSNDSQCSIPTWYYEVKFMIFMKIWAI